MHAYFRVSLYFLITRKREHTVFQLHKLTNVFSERRTRLTRLKHIPMYYLQDSFKRVCLCQREIYQLLYGQLAWGL